MDIAAYTPLNKVTDKKKIFISNYVWGIILLLLCIIIKIFSLFPYVVENYYSRGIYIYISSFYRFIFGWIPFSFGDIFYFFTGLYLLYILYDTMVLIFRKNLTKILLLQKLKSIVYTCAVVYIYFNLSWGLNYNRPGIASQLNISPELHNVKDLKMITQKILEKLNTTRLKLTGDKVFSQPYNQIFMGAQHAYQSASTDLPFMTIKNFSVKRSMYGRMGNFLGFLGYYNPFTGEAQLNLTMPRFLIPYVVCHEMAHQLGYANESEASMVGYLAAIKSKDDLFKYSTYFDFFQYANHELAIRDSVSARYNITQLNPLVKEDMAEVKTYWKKSENVVEPFVKIFYDHFLKANHQTSGIKSYNEVIGWLIAYYKKTGDI